jgi:hypothetical protein
VTETRDQEKGALKEEFKEAGTKPAERAVDMRADPVTAPAVTYPTSTPAAGSGAGNDVDKPAKVASKEGKPEALPGKPVSCCPAFGAACAECGKFTKKAEEQANKDVENLAKGRTYSITGMDLKAA